MKIKNRVSFFVGVAIVVVLLISYFVEISYFNGFSITSTKILGLLILYNPFVLALYLLIAVFFIVKGFKKSK